MTRLVVVIAALGFVVALSPGAAAQSATVSLTGTWTVSLEGPNGPMSIALVLKQDEKAITGTIDGPQGGAVPIKGDITDGRLSFSMNVTPPDGAGAGGEMQITWVGRLENTDAIRGSLTTPMGEIPWKAARVKEAK